MMQSRAGLCLVPPLPYAQDRSNCWRKQSFAVFFVLSFPCPTLAARAWLSHLAPCFHAKHSSMGLPLFCKPTCWWISLVGISHQGYPPANLTGDRCLLYLVSPFLLPSCPHATTTCHPSSYMHRFAAPLPTTAAAPACATPSPQSPACIMR